MIVSRYEKKNHMDFMKYSVFHRSPCGFFWFQDKKEQMGKLRQKGSGGQIMLEKVDLTMKMEKSEYKAKMNCFEAADGKTSETV